MNPITMNLVADEYIRRALQEDITSEDISTMSVCPARREAQVQLIAKADGVIAGLGVFERALRCSTPRRAWMPACKTASASRTASCSPWSMATRACCCPASAWR